WVYRDPAILRLARAVAGAKVRQAPRREDDLTPLRAIGVGHSRRPSRGDAFHPVGLCHHSWTAVENVDISAISEAFFFQHPHSCPTRRMRHADRAPRSFAEHRDIDRVLGHEISNE